MKALVKEGNSVAVRTVPVPNLSSDREVLIQVKMAGICRTDVYAAEGKIKSADPLILGHEFSGVIVELGSKVLNLKKEDRVSVNPSIPCRKCEFCITDKSHYCQNAQFLGLDLHGAFAEYIAVPAASTFRLPEQMSFQEGAYMEPVAASLAVLKSGIHPTEKGLIYGDNRISRLTQKILVGKGFRDVSIYDPNLNDQSLIPHHYDFMIETLATNNVLSEIVQAMRPGGKVILKSRSSHRVGFQLNEILKKELTFHAVNYGSFQESLDLMAHETIQVSDLLGESYPLEDFERAFSDSQGFHSRKLFFSFLDQ